MNQKKELVIVRLPKEWVIKISENEAVIKAFNIHAVNSELIEGENIKSSYLLTDDMEELKNHLIKNKIDTAIISQKLFPLSMKVAEVCEELEIMIVWTEAFFDNKLIFDTVGLPYCPDNEIVRYKDVITYPDNFVELTEKPRSTRQPQEKTISLVDLLHKYDLISKDKIVVLLMQTIFDMSLKYSINPHIKNYKTFIDRIIRENEDVTFLFKLHPQYYGAHEYRRDEDMGFMRQYENAIEMRESLQTLFKAFIHFVSFSSTTIFEGLLNGGGLRFASAGYHFMNSPDMVLQLKDKEYTNLYENLAGFRPSPYDIHKRAYFVCNYYAIDTGSSRLVDKLSMEPEEYYFIRKRGE